MKVKFSKITASVYMYSSCDHGSYQAHKENKVKISPEICPFLVVLDEALMS